MERRGDEIEGWWGEGEGNAGFIIRGGGKWVETVKGVFIGWGDRLGARWVDSY